MCFFLRGHKFKSKEGYGIYTVDFKFKFKWLGERALIHQFGVWLDRDLKNRLLLLL
jgi:hypothetical protein